MPSTLQLQPWQEEYLLPGLAQEAREGQHVAVERVPQDLAWGSLSLCRHLLWGLSFPATAACTLSVQPTDICSFVHVFTH